MSVSVPFCAPSLQRGAWQTPFLQALVVQSEPDAQKALGFFVGVSHGGPPLVVI